MRHGSRTALALTAGSLLFGAPTASAGTYEVRACHDAANNSWASYRSDSSSDAYAQCPGGFSGGEGLVARNTGGAGNAAQYSQAMMYFDTPPGAAVVRVTGNYRMNAAWGWHAGIHDMVARRWVLCGSVCSSTFGGWYGFDVGGLATTRIAALVVCASSCRRDALHGVMALSHVTVTVAENGAPGVAIAGGSLVQGGWRRGVQGMAVEAWDYVGIRQIRASVDGGAPVFDSGRSCDDTRPVPCPNGTDTLQFNTRTLEDGAHHLRVTAVDSAQNSAAQDTTIHVDNTAPSSPRSLSLAGGGAWQSRNEFMLRWDNPPQSAAPIAAATLAVCPVGQPPLDVRGCTTLTRSGSELGEIGDIQVPGPGQWTARLWLRDAAGNESPESATETTLRFDDEPPELDLEPPTVERPAQLRVAARDTVSGLAAGEIELQRAGTTTWTSLPGRLDAKGFSATVDDEALANGTYRVRARAVDHAGNERTTDRRADGEPLGLTLPLRITTRLVAGRPKRVRARGSQGARRYRIVLIDHPRSRYGRTIPLRGRLTTPGANPLAGREIEVFELSIVQGATWRRIATVATSRTGRFTFMALRGPSRILRFRYPGTETIRGRSAEVSLRVRAATSLRVSRRNVVNGEEVTFRGRLKGQPIPPGKLVELQAYSRGRWLTFATPRANQRSGLWSHRYRFAATRGNVRYRFRARVPRETSYPYETGTSATIRVSVRGL